MNFSLPHGRTCLTIPDNDPEAWRAGLEAPIADPDRRQAMGTAVREWAMAHGSLDTTGPQWANALGLPVPPSASIVAPPSPAA